MIVKMATFRISLSWRSNIDGVIGSGATFSTSTLSEGTHTITASVTENGGLPGSEAITVTVVSSDYIDCNRQLKSRNVLYRDLDAFRWGCSSPDGYAATLYAQDGEPIHGLSHPQLPDITIFYVVELSTTREPERVHVRYNYQGRSGHSTSQSKAGWRAMERC